MWVRVPTVELGVKEKERVGFLVCLEEVSGTLG